MKIKTTIASVVDDALDAAYLAHIIDGCVFGPVNWADLECVDVERTGDGWTAYVEEAAPECVGLRNHVEATLVKNGLANVTVVTRW